MLHLHYGQIKKEETFIEYYAHIFFKSLFITLFYLQKQISWEGGGL